MHAVRKICDCDGTTESITKIWDQILHLLPISWVKEDMLATFQLLKSVITCVPKYENLSERDEEEKKSMLNDLAIKVSHTSQLLKECQCLTKDREVTEEMLAILGLLFLLHVSKLKEQVKD